MLRKNSVLRTRLGADAFDFLVEATGAFQRLLPHTDITAWSENRSGEKSARWASTERRQINVCVNLVKAEPLRRALHAVVSRKQGAGVGKIQRTLDDRELDLCQRIAEKVAEHLSKPDIRKSPDALRALRSRFDEAVVADHLREYHKFDVDLRVVFEQLRTLAAQTYENRSIALGCIIDPSLTSSSSLSFPSEYFRQKKFKALTDGYRTAYLVSSSGSLVGLVDLENYEPDAEGSAKDFYPEWAQSMARVSRQRRCGIALTRAGDILVFNGGALRFVYRFGRWRYLNHSHIVDLLKNLARVQKVKTTGPVTRAAYRTALDVSFRRSGGMVVILRARTMLRQLVREGDAIGDEGRGSSDSALDAALPGQFIQGISRRVLAELAGLDGAVVVANSGRLLAYGAILRARGQRRIRRSEGSRTKAAIGASRYGLVVKVSSDGDIEVFARGSTALVV